MPSRTLRVAHEVGTARVAPHEQTIPLLGSDRALEELVGGALQRTAPAT